MLDSDSVISLPLPLLTALLGAVIAVLISRIDWGSRAASLFLAALFGLLSFSAVLVALRFGYGLDGVIFVQRLTPLQVGPLMYLGFAAYAAPRPQFRKLAQLHLGSAIAVIAVIATLPKPIYVLDWVISLSYLIYIVLLLRLWRRGPDNLIHARLDVAPNIVNWMLRGAMLLGSILIFDTAIALDFLLNGGRNVKTMISIGTIPSSLLLLALIIVLPSMLTKGVTTPTVREAGGAEDSAQDMALEAQARAFLNDSQLYLEPDLSVQRLSRRLHVPVRSLSNAINQTQGMNVSQYVNRFRLEHAADLLRGTDESVAKVMAQSGFLTRSNFYREFQRMYDLSPAAYRDTQAGKS